MNFVLTTFGSAGDVFPMLGLAIKLQQRGHRVLLATNGYFAPLADRYGIPFESLGTSQQYLECIQNPDLWNPRKGFRNIHETFQPELKRQHEILVEMSREQSTVGIASCLCFGARMAQESHGIPVLTLHLQPAVIWSDIAPPLLPKLFGPRWLKSLLFRLAEKFSLDPIVCPFLNTWRKELGLAPIHRIVRWWNSPSGMLCLFPDWYAPPQPDWPHPFIQADFPLWNDASHLPLPEELLEFLDAGDPPLVFTPGSANVHGRDFFTAGVQACQNLGRRGILLTRHPEQLPASLPQSVRHISYAPLDLLLPRSAAFIHHGGVGSTSQALLAGIPQLIMPLAHDQFDNAARVVKLNAGTSLSVRDFTAANVTQSLRSLLNSKKVMDGCRDASNRLKPRCGLTIAADAIENRFGTAARTVPVPLSDGWIRDRE